MIKKFFAIALTASLAAGCCCHKHHEDDKACEHCEMKKKMAEESEGGVKEEKLTADQVPQTVRDAWVRDYPNVTPTKYEKETDKDGTVRYEITYRTSSGEKEEVLYTAEGKRVSEK